MIINGNIFYLINILDNISTISAFGFVIMIPVIGALAYYKFDSCLDEEEEKKFKRVCRDITVLTIIMIILVIAIPSEETMYKMWLSKYITTDNINMTLDELKELVDYLATKISEVSK